MVARFWLCVFGRRLRILPVQSPFSLLKVTILFFLWETNLFLLSVPIPGQPVARPGDQHVPFLWPNDWFKDGNTIQNGTNEA